MSDEGLPPPGYYPDPDNAAVQRWWDGNQWAVPPPPMTPGAPTPPLVRARPTTNGFAVASLVMGLAWVFFLGSILAVVFGHVAVAQIRRSEGREGGRGLAIAGLIVGYLGLALLVLAVMGLAVSRSSS